MWVVWAERPSPAVLLVRVYDKHLQERLVRYKYPYCATFCVRPSTALHPYSLPPSLPSTSNTMSVEQLRPFPTHFRLKDLTAITSPVFEFKTNPHQEAAAQATNVWFER